MFGIDTKYKVYVMLLIQAMHSLGNHYKVHFLLNNSKQTIESGSIRVRSHFLLIYIDNEIYVVLCFLALTVLT